MSAGMMAALSAGADLAGGYLSYKGQQNSNAQNLKIAREQMNFQERMSSTAYQRAAKDLEAAGLNRILALGSPASSPAGVSIPMQNEHSQTPAAFSAASAKARMREEIKLLQDQQGQTQSQTLLNNANARKAAAEASQAEVMKVLFDALSPTAKDFGQWLKSQLSSTAKDSPGLLDKVRSSATDVMEAVGSSAKGIREDLQNLKPLDLVPEQLKKKLRELKDSDYPQYRDVYDKYFEEH